MFSLHKRRILTTALPFEYGDLRRAKWWLTDESLIPVAQAATAAIDAAGESGSSRDLEVLKSDERRLIVRIASSQSGGDPFIVKVSPLRCLRHRLKYHSLKYDRFAFGEAVNLLAAAERGLNVPKVYGYGCIYGSCRLATKDILILQDLAPRVQVDDLLEQSRGDEKKCAAVLDRTIPTFLALYKAHCNHININMHAVMLGEEDSGRDDYVLDFEYTQFHDTPNPEVLMFEAGRFGNRCSACVATKTIYAWKDKLLDAIGIEAGRRREEMTGYFEYYFSRELSRKDRQRIGVS